MPQSILLSPEEFAAIATCIEENMQENGDKITSIVLVAPPNDQPLEVIVTGPGLCQMRYRIQEVQGSHNISPVDPDNPMQTQAI